MDCVVFEKWFKTLLQKLSQPSIIVMDNASYHSRRTTTYPTSKWKKAQLQEWLTSNSIPWTADMLRPEIWRLVKHHRPRHSEYVCDEMASLHGHRVLRLPPYHSELNPIELVWGQVKGYVSRNNTAGFQTLSKV